MASTPHTMIENFPGFRGSPVSLASLLLLSMCSFSSSQILDLVPAPVLTFKHKTSPHIGAVQRTPVHRRLGNQLDIVNDQGNGLSYYVKGKFGSRSDVSFLVDTGSSEIWVAANDDTSKTEMFVSYGPNCCSSGICCSGNATCESRPTDSSACTFQTVYGSGPVFGLIGHSSLQIGDVQIDKLQAGLKTNSVMGLAIPAILGLALPDLASFTHPTMMDVITSLAFSFSPNPKSLIDNRLYLGSDTQKLVLPSGLVWKDFPVEQSIDIWRGHWSIVLKDVTVAGNSFLGQDASSTDVQKTILDSGTSLLIAPSSVYKDLIAQITSDEPSCELLQCNPELSLYTCRSIEKLKPIVFSFVTASEIVQFSLQPQSFTETGICGDSTQYSLLLDTSTNDKQWILGLAFMRGFGFTKFESAQGIPTVSIACGELACDSQLYDASAPSGGGSKFPTLKIVLIIASVVVGLVIIALVVLFIMKRRKPSKKEQHTNIYFTNETPMFPDSPQTSNGQPSWPPKSSNNKETRGKAEADLGEQSESTFTVTTADISSTSSNRSMMRPAMMRGDVYNSGALPLPLVTSARNHNRQTPSLTRARSQSAPIQTRSLEDLDV